MNRALHWLSNTVHLHHLLRIISAPRVDVACLGLAVQRDTTTSKSSRGDRTHGSLTDISCGRTAWIVKVVSSVRLLPPLSMNLENISGYDTQRPELTSAMAWTWIGVVGASGTPANFTPSSQRSQDGSVPGGDLKSHRIVSEAA